MWPSGKPHGGDWWCGLRWHKIRAVDIVINGRPAGTSGDDLGLARPCRNEIRRDKGRRASLRRSGRQLRCSRGHNRDRGTVGLGHTRGCLGLGRGRLRTDDDTATIRYQQYDYPMALFTKSLEHSHPCKYPGKPLY